MRVRRTKFAEYLFILIGVVTPIGVLAVNGSAYVMQHLAQFDVILGASALVSSIFLMGVSFRATLGHVSRRIPNFYAEYRTWAIVLSVLIVVGWSALGAWGTYLSMRDPSRLPNLPAVLVSLALLAMPIVTVLGSRQLEARRSARAQRAEAAASRRSGVRPRAGR